MEELEPGSGVFIKSADLKAVRQSAVSGTDVARKLAKKIFHPDALLACSVSGHEATGKGKEQSERRPKLDPNAVSAIIGKSIFFYILFYLLYLPC